MARNKMGRDSLPERFNSLNEFTEFWDAHDITDYPEVWRETELKVNLLRRSYAVPLSSKLAKELRLVARAKRTTVQRLVNRWLEERLRAA